MTPQEKLDDYAIMKESGARFRKNQYLKLYALKAKLGILPEQYQPLQNRIDDLEKQVKAQNRKDLIFLTINPKPDVDLFEFLIEVHAIASRKMFLNGTYTLEQRGTTPETLGTGIHAHFAMMRDPSYKPSKIAKILSTSLLKKEMIGNARHVDVRQYPNKYYAEKVDYMKGNKWDEGKHDAVKMNKDWRVQNDLKNVYVKSI